MLQRGIQGCELRSRRGAMGKTLGLSALGQVRSVKAVRFPIARPRLQAAGSLGFDPSRGDTAELTT